MGKYIIFILLWVNSSLFAQTAKEELQHLSDTYQTSKGYNLKMQYSYYGDGQSAPIQTVNGISQQTGEQIYFKIGHVEQVADKDAILTIDSEEKYVIYDKKEKYDRYKTPADFKSMLLEAENNGGKLVVEQISGSNYVLKVMDTETNKTVYAYFYDRSIFQISKMVVYYDAAETEMLYGDEFETSRLEIQVEYLAPAAPILQVDNVIHKTAALYRLNQPYKGYTFHDLTQQN